MATLVIVRGPPGTGKSTIARKLVKRLGFEHYEADMYHTRNGFFDFQSSRAVAAHHWCQSKMRGAMRRGVPAVVANPLLTEWDVETYTAMSKDVILVDVTHHYGSTHAPPHIEYRMRREFVGHEEFDYGLPPHVRVMTEEELSAWIETEARHAEPKPS